MNGDKSFGQRAFGYQLQSATILVAIWELLFKMPLRLLSYRYNNNYNTLAFASALFPIMLLRWQTGRVDIFPFGSGDDQHGDAILLLTS